MLMVNVIFQSTGKIFWDYEISSVPVYLYDDSSGTTQFGLEILCMLLLGINVLLEVFGVSSRS